MKVRCNENVQCTCWFENLGEKNDHFHTNQKWAVGTPSSQRQSLLHVLPVGHLLQFIVWAASLLYPDLRTKESKNVGILVGFFNTFVLVEATFLGFLKQLHNFLYTILALSYTKSCCNFSTHENTFSVLQRLLFVEVTSNRIFGL